MLHPARALALGALLLASLAAGPARAQDAPDSAAAPSVGPDSAVLASIEDQVVAIRQLDKLADVDLRFLDHDSLHSYLLETFERDYLPEEREADQKEYQL